MSNSIFVNAQMAFNEDTGVVGANERVVPLSAQIGESDINSLPSEWVPKNEEIGHAVALSEIMYLAGQSGVTELEITFSLEYNDSTGEREPIEVVSTRVNPQEYDSFGRALQEGQFRLPV
ncbi:hypothetical protein [Haloplanus salinarum]|uniref:hypothetical protein n=1 Tax=Haloplanus salinarum TaxID=1912324 RepID=UPI00214C82B4|nr:hypothetical protein [Haloplanus salinarum]